jgi:putative FmdB family regulatory protein
MPRYDYECHKCEIIMEIVHSYKKPIDKCPKCSSSDINKVLSSPLRRVNIKNKNHRPGTKVQKAIESSREDLIQQRNELQKNRSSS